MKSTFLALATTTFLTATLFAQGDLNPPPGGPTATMKTLDQLEARTPIPKSPAIPIAGPHFSITASGSYYLTGNITVSTGSAIVVADGINNVTLNLNGFTIASTLTGSASGSAIELLGNLTGFSISHGNISSGTTFTSAGVVTPAGFENGIKAFQAQQANVTQVHVRGLASDGIFLDSQSIITECTAYHCGGYGIVGETITNSNASHCRLGGILAKTAINCFGESSNGVGIRCTGNANNCIGNSISNGVGIRCTGNANNCIGNSIDSLGIYCTGNIINCTGTSSNGAGILCSGNATNCTGTSIVDKGIFCGGSATNCDGTSSASSQSGVYVIGTASSCRGKNTSGGPALYAGIAISCTTGGGAISSPSKHLGTP